MSEEDIKLLLEMKHNCLKDNGTSNETYNDSKRLKKAKAIDNALQEIERLNTGFDSLEQIIRYYVMDNFKYDNNTAEYILERLLMFWGKDSDKE